MRSIKLTIKPFRNLSGSTSWRVMGTLYGERIRRNFRDRMDALDGKRALELRAIQGAAGLRSTATLLSEPQLRQAEAAFEKIKDLPQTLAYYLDYALANCKPGSQKTLSEAKADYIQQREADRKRNFLTEISFNSIKGQMKKLDEMFPGLLVADLDAEKIIRYCEDGGAAWKTHNNRRDAVSAFLKFALDNEWISKNPIGKVPRYQTAHKRGSAVALTAEQARALMEYVETYEGGKMVPFYALCLFAGIRPDACNGEIGKLRVEDINLETSTIHIQPEVSKVQMKRNVTIQPNLAAWLKAYPLDRYPIVIPKMQEHRAVITKKFGLTHDILRHTFISMHVAKFRSMGDTALQAGNSEGIIRKHYLDVKSPAEAEEFFKIAPKLKDVPLKIATESKSETSAAA